MKKKIEDPVIVCKAPVLLPSEDRLPRRFWTSKTPDCEGFDPHQFVREINEQVDEYNSNRKEARTYKSRDGTASIIIAASPVIPRIMYDEELKNFFCEKNWRIK